MKAALVTAPAPRWVTVIVYATCWPGSTVVPEPGTAVLAMEYDPARWVIEHGGSVLFGGQPRPTTAFCRWPSATWSFTRTA